MRSVINVCVFHRIVKVTTTMLTNDAHKRINVFASKLYNSFLLKIILSLDYLDILLLYIVYWMEALEIC